MQLIDDTVMGGVRSAVMTLARRDSPVRFVTVPMVHLATPAFYDEVQQLMEACDVVVVEGVEGRRVGLLTSSYRIAGHFRTSGLILQSEGMDLSALPGVVRRPDMTAEQFDAGWSGIRWWWRLLLMLASPVVGVWMAILGPDRVMRGAMTVNDLPSFEEWDDPMGFDEFIVHSRDRLLCAELRRIEAELGHLPITVGVCWGAHHMRAVMHTLGNELGYRIVHAEWITVFPPQS